MIMNEKEMLASLTDLHKRFMEIGNHEKALEVLKTIQELRATNEQVSKPESKLLFG